MPADAARMVRQHARTLQLLGVDFVPLRPVAAPPSPSPLAADEPEPAIARAPARPPIAAAASVSVSVTVVEPKPRAEFVPPAGLPSRSGPIVPPPVVEMDERRRESQARLDRVRERYEADAPHTRFATDHHSIVFGEGDPCARLMFIGEAPGAEEDKAGRPFVGPAGQLLEKMIVAMGLSRGRVYIANVLKTRPPNNATPTIEEAALCAPYLYDQIAVVRPEAIVALGLPATRVMLNNTVDPMAKLRGRWHDWTRPGGMFSSGQEWDGRVPIMPTYHPAFLLRAYTAENRAKVWSDLRLVMDRLGLGAGQSA
jgi:uracil-DNA glycosylase